MSYVKGSFGFIFILLVVVGIVSVLAWLYSAEFTSYADMQTALTITTETFGVLLGIITAGLMFTHGKFSELSSELSEKSPQYLADVLSLEKIQSIETSLIALRKAFTKLATNTTITEEKNLYERVITGASSIFVNFAVLLNLKLKQQGLPDTGLLTSEMDSNLYRIYEKEIKSIKKEWQPFSVISNIIDIWEAPAAFLTGKSKRKSSLQADLKSSMSIWKIKEKIDKSLAGTRSEVENALNDLDSEIDEISKQFHEDRIPQLLLQMEQANTLRGRYFFLAVMFITTPLLVNLLILPQLTEATATLFKPIIAVTSALSAAGVVFLLLYIHKILNV